MSARKRTAETGRVGLRTGRINGVRVLVTRPEPAAARLADAFAAEGAVVHRVPALAIAPVEDAKSAEHLRDRLADVSVIVFTSVNAVEGFFGLAPGAAPDRLPAQVLAVGRATAEALRTRGAAGVCTPRDRFDSEGLLACPQLQVRKVTGRLVAVVKGEGGRDLLGNELLRRGARVVEANVYRRRAPERLAAMLEAVRDSVDIVTVTSVEALRNLAGAAPWTASWLSDRTLVTASERIARIARAGNLSRVVVAAGADAASIVDAVARAVVGSSGGGGTVPGAGPWRCRYDDGAGVRDKTAGGVPETPRGPSFPLPRERRER